MSGRSFNLSCCIFAAIFSIPANYYIYLLGFPNAKYPIFAFAALTLIIPLATALGSHHAKKDSWSDHGYMAGVYTSLFIVGISAALLTCYFCIYALLWPSESYWILIPVILIYFCVVAFGISLPACLCGAWLYNFLLPISKIFLSKLRTKPRSTTQ
jgi:hypothetical protein